MGAIANVAIFFIMSRTSEEVERARECIGQRRKYSKRTAKWCRVENTTLESKIHLKVDTQSLAKCDRVRCNAITAYRNMFSYSSKYTMSMFVWFSCTKVPNTIHFRVQSEHSTEMMVDLPRHKPMLARSS